MEGASVKGQQEGMIDRVQPLQPVTGLAPFVDKLYKIVNDPDTDDAVSWSLSKDSLIVNSPSLLSTKVLPKFFKHNNYSSFRRQLNNYGFRSIRNREFAHEGFKGGQEHLLETIKRQNDSIAAPKADNFELEKISGDCLKLTAEVAEMKQHQLHANKLLQAMERKLQQMMEFVAKASLDRTSESFSHRQKKTKEIFTRRKRMLNPRSSGGNTKGEAYEAVPVNSTLQEEPGAIVSNADVGKNWGRLTREENAPSSPIIVQNSIHKRKARKEIDVGSTRIRRLIASSSEGVNVTQQEELGAIRSNIAPALDNDSTSEFKGLGGAILSTSGTNVSNADGGKKWGQLAREKGAPKKWGQLVCENGAHSNSKFVDNGKPTMEDTDRPIASSSGEKFMEEVCPPVGVIATQQEELGPNESNIAPANDSTIEFKDLKKGPIPSTSGTNLCECLPCNVFWEDEASAFLQDLLEADFAVESLLNNDLDSSGNL